MQTNSMFFFFPVTIHAFHLHLTLQTCTTNANDSICLDITGNQTTINETLTLMLLKRCLTVNSVLQTLLKIKGTKHCGHKTTYVKTYTTYLFTYKTTQF